ncbi:MAG TPA: FHA domain-containing protein [Gemmatimonadaceae bacterium]|nr:FHA domain-containing protein [Gemmatimonadaceae bacterium]
MPHLTLLEKGSGKVHRINGPEALVGRDPACGLFVEGDNAKTVSGRHARFFLDEDRWCVEDAGSRNGTFIGTRKLEPGGRHVLGVGDVIGLGLTGTQLAVQEAVGRAFAATMVEAHAVPATEEVRVVLRGAQSGIRSTAQGDSVTIGRALECLIRVEGESATSVSRVHARISAVAGQPTISDDGSRHGTFVNGSKLEAAAPLNAGDVITLGPGGPTFTVEEAVVLPASPTAASSAAGLSSEPRGAGYPSTSKASSPAAPDPAGSGALDEGFKSELPTPPMGRPAVRASKSPGPGPSAPATRSTRESSALSRNLARELSARNAQRIRVVTWAAVALLVVATAVIVFIAKETNVLP